MSGTLKDRAAVNRSVGIGKGVLNENPSNGGGIGAGAGSGGNLKTVHEGNSPGKSEGPAPDMVDDLLLGGANRLYIRLLGRVPARSSCVEWCCMVWCEAYVVVKVP